MIQSPTSRGTKTLYRPGSAATAPAPVSRARNPSALYKNPLPGSNGSNGNGTVNGTRRRKSKKASLWSPWKLILLSIILGIAGSLYLTHVFQTQDTLREVQQQRREFERAHRIHTDVRRNYDRMTGPAEVYRQAESFGMVTGGAADPIIIMER